MLLFSLSLLSASTAVAQVRVAILTADLRGELGAEADGPIVESLAAGFRPSASEVLTPTEVAERLSEPVEIVSAMDEQRLADFGQQVGTETLAIIEVDQFEQHYAIRVDLILAQDGSHLASTSLECTACTWSEALSTVNRAGRGLTSALPGLLAMNLSPAGASVTIDGITFVGDAPAVLRPGSHRIAATATGFVETEQEVQIEPGVLTEVSLNLTPAETVQPREREMSAMRIWAWVTGGAALLTAIPGVVWLALDGSCPLDWDTNAGTCPEVYNLWPQGLATMLLSTALLSTSIALFVVDSRRLQASAAVVGYLLPRQDGLNFGISAHF
jgi:hypothetical protein